MAGSRERVGALGLRMLRAIPSFFPGPAAQTRALSVSAVAQVELQGEAPGSHLPGEGWGSCPNPRTPAETPPHGPRAWQSASPPCPALARAPRALGPGSGVRALAGAAAGGLPAHVLVGGGFQEARIRVLLHQRARLGLGLVEAGGGGPREVLAGDLPGFVVDVHLQGSSAHKR